MPLLPAPMIRELHQIAVQAGFDREALLRTIDPRVVAGLARASAPAAQLLMDLDRLNQMGEIRDGSVPLQIWLENAMLLLTTSAEEEAVKRALRVLNEKLGRTGGGSGAAAGTGGAPSGPCVILFLTANPTSTTRLALDEEMRLVDQELRGADYRVQVRIETGPAARATDLTQLLLRHKPALVHFSGHGSSAGELWFNDEQGGIATVQPATLSKIFGALAGETPVRGVILNACHSAAQAAKILENVDFVVGMSTTVKDSSARRFAGTFYQALAFGRSLQAAFNLGCLQIDIGGHGQGDVPQLLVRDGLQADRIHLAGPRATT